MSNDHREDGPDTAALRALMEQWWQPPQELISTLPKGGVALSYLGHADTTRALIEADPAWEWTPMAHTDEGLPVLDRDDAGRPIGLWIYMTVCGRTIPAYGSCLPNARDAVKELIGDAIRNGAMRFGVAGALWSKADRSDEQQEPPPPKAKAKPKAQTEQPPAFDGKAAYLELADEFGADEVKAAFVAVGAKGTGSITEAHVAQVRAMLALDGEVAA